MSLEAAIQIFTVALDTKEAFTESGNISTLSTDLYAFSWDSCCITYSRSEAFIEEKQLSIHMSIPWKEPCTSMVLFPLTHNHE